MNKTIKRCTGLFLIFAMFLLTSCEGMNPAVINQIAGGLAGGLGGGLIGGSIAGRSDNAVKIAAALIVTVAVIAIVNHYQATNRQRELAREQAEDNLRSSKVKQKMAANKVRKVGVVVPASEGHPKGIALADENGKPTGEVYVPKDGGSAKEGGIIDLGGTKAYMANSWQGV